MPGPKGGTLRTLAGRGSSARSTGSPLRPSTEPGSTRSPPGRRITAQSSAARCCTTQSNSGCSALPRSRRASASSLVMHGLYGALQPSVARGVRLPLRTAVGTGRSPRRSQGTTPSPCTAPHAYRARAPTASARGDTHLNSLLTSSASTRAPRRIALLLRHVGDGRRTSASHGPGQEKVRGSATGTMPRPRWPSQLRQTVPRRHGGAARLPSSR